MPLQSGTKLGPYEILSPIGAGGMGEVYKAADTRLNRTVAIKVLPAHFSENLEMKQRFEREAQTIAALSHPHICTLFDVGRQEGTEFLVMEYLEGESLAQRLTRGLIPVDEALKVAIEIADALDKAHGQGVTHRDLKPGNVMLTKGGAKLLDFGLAKLKVQPQSSRPKLGSPPPGDTTQPGMILGTMQYMAPEQLEGNEADARTDIFAFGALLYEMLTGKKAFDGRSQALLIASIMSADPDPPSKSQPGVPGPLDYVVKRCLTKDPEQRWQSARDLVCQLQWVAGGGTEAGTASPVSAKGRRLRILTRLALVMASLLVAVMALPAIRYYHNAQPMEVTRFLISVPDMPAPEAVSISPDSKWVAYSARDGGATSLFVRPIDSEVSTKLPGTEGAGGLFWSPDSRSIGFFAGGKLKKVEAAGGPPQNICETPELLGATWNADGLIVFASNKGLLRVLAAGGEPALIAESQKDNRRQEPYFLPDGRHYLFLGTSGQPSSAAIYVGSLDSKDATRLVTTQSNAIYAEPGYLLYHREGTLYAQSFSPRKLTLAGDAIRLADKLPYAENGAAAFAASQNGVLIYRNSPQSPSGAIALSRNLIPSVPLIWVDRAGTKVEQASGPAGWAGVDLSPDGKQIAVHRHDEGGGNVWILSAGNETPSKFTFDDTQDNSMPTWSPDGTRIAFGSKRNGKWGIYLKLADNTRNEELVIDSDNPVVPMSWSPDGKLLVYSTSDPKSSGDIWAVPLTGEKKPVPILQTSSDERHPQVSPDGKWLAYSSNESGRSEIYIKSFPEGPAKIQVSVNGGVFPRWRHDGQELYFMNLVTLGNMMTSDIRVAGASIQRQVPHVLFQSVYVNGIHTGGQYHAYAVSANGQRFLVPEYENAGALFASGAVGRGAAATVAGILPSIIADRHASSAPTANSTAPITVVLNWTAALKSN